MQISLDVQTPEKYTINDCLANNYEVPTLVYICSLKLKNHKHIGKQLSSLFYGSSDQQLLVTLCFKWLHSVLLHLENQIEHELRHHLQGDCVQKGILLGCCSLFGNNYKPYKKGGRPSFCRARKTIWNSVKPISFGPEKNLFILVKTDLEIFRKHSYDSNYFSSNAVLSGKYLYI